MIASFLEMTHRFQSARADIRALLLQCLLPWLENMELVAASVPPATPLSYIMYYPDSGVRGRREGSGTPEATEMVLNNLFFITAKVNSIITLFVLYVIFMTNVSMLLFVVLKHFCLRNCGC